MAIRIDGSSVFVPRNTLAETPESRPQTSNVGISTEDAFVDRPMRAMRVVPGPGGDSSVAPPPAVVQNQNDLVQARETLGAAMQKLQQYEAQLSNPLWELWPGNWGKIATAERAVSRAKANLQQAQNTEQADIAQYGAAAVERARFQSFGQQLRTLEREHGKNAAARLVRQVYYDNLNWDSGPTRCQPVSPSCCSPVCPPRRTHS